MEAAFPGRLMQATPPQDTSWGVKRVSAHWVWAGGSLGPSTRGEWAFVTMLDAGVDSVHRWSASGDGPESLNLDCYWVEGSGSSCYDDHPIPTSRGHGAHVAGIIAGRSNEYGYIGIAHNLHRFASIKVCGQLNGQWNCRPEWVASGLDWVLDQTHPRRILNVGLGFCSDYTLLSQMVANLAAAGVLVIASAGNHYPGASEQQVCGSNHHLGGEWATGVLWPARYSQVMAVSGTLEDDSFAAAPPPDDDDGGGNGYDPCGPGEECAPTGGSCGNGSRYGPQVEIAAPFWAWSMWGSGQYKAECGTSMSAPVVAGVAALVWSHNPSYTATQVRGRLTSTALPYSPATQFGAGRINAQQAVYGPPPTTYSASITGPAEVLPYATCSFTATTTSPDAPYTYEWFVDGSPVGYYGSYYYHTASAAAFTLSITIVDSQNREMHGVKNVSVNPSAPECLDT